MNIILNQSNPIAKAPLLLLLLTFSISVCGQSFKIVPVDEVQIFEDDVIKPLAHCGGLNSPIISQVDLNQDGILDVYIFDRLGKVNLPLLRTQSGEYKLEETLTHRLPYAEYWMKMLDINADGIPDILASSDDTYLDEIRLFFGRWENEKLFFRAYDNAIGGSFLTYSSNGQQKAILVNSKDIPAISDIDNDGDLDILTFNTIGDYVVYYKNICIDSGFALSQPLFVLEDECWGKFHEDGSGQGVTFSLDPNQCALGFNQNSPERSVHNGATLLAIDIDDDQDKDLLFGDPASLFVTLLYNWGTPESAHIRDEETKFPSSLSPHPKRYLPYPQEVFINDDTIADLIISPFQTDGEDVDVIDALIREKDGSITRTKSWIEDQFLDHGSLSHPAAVDIDGDGWQDLVIFIGKRFDANGPDRSHIVAYRNRGTSPASFELIDSNWLDLSRFDINDIALSPAFGDLNDDGKLDLILGGASGKLYYFENQAVGPERFRFNQVNKNYMDIDVNPPLGSYSVPELFDVNGDGLLDLLIGSFNGELTYFENIGSQTAPYFEPDPQHASNTSNWGGINVSEAGQTNGNASPMIHMVGGRNLLFLGAENGRLMVYDLEEVSTGQQAQPLVESQLFIGERIKTCISDWDQDGTLELVIGNKRGGLSFYQLSSTVHSSTPIDQSIGILQNPVGKTIHFSGLVSGRYNIYDMAGHSIQQGQLNNKTALRLHNASRGLYILKITFEGQTTLLKFCKL